MMKVQHEPPTPFELFGVDAGKGWRPLIEPIYQRIQQLNAEGANIEVSQIKEKFGMLRIYVHNAPDEIHEMILGAERQSIHICEDCGEPAKRVVGEHKWIYTLCPKCLEKRGIKVIETIEEANTRRG